MLAGLSTVPWSTSMSTCARARGGRLGESKAWRLPALTFTVRLPRISLLSK